MGENTRKFNKLSLRITQRVEQNIRGVALGIHAGLVEETPVDTGWAKNNWIPRVGRPFEETVGSPENPDPAAAQPGLNEVARWKSGKGPINITNNVPYIGRLNRGSSKQAPAGFVERIVQREARKIGRF